MTDPVHTENLSAYLDGELGQAEAAELVARLRVDPALQAELDALRAAVELLRSHGPAQAPPQVQAAIRDAVAREKAPGGVLAFLRRPLGLPIQGLAVAAVAVIVVAIALSAGTELGFRPAMLGVGPERELPADVDAAPLELQAPRDDGRAPAVGGVATSSKSMGEAGKSGPDDIAADGAPPDLPVPAQADGQADDAAIPPDAEPPDTKSALAVGKGGAGAGYKGGSELYGGVSLHTIALREQDLAVIARLLQKHGALDVQGRDPASRVAELESGEHDLALRLPDTPSRNAFVTDLRRTFAGAHSERVVDDGSLSLAGAQVGLRLVVTPYIPNARTDP